jgi:hypothetical protein
MKNHGREGYLESDTVQRPSVPDRSACTVRSKRAAMGSVPRWSVGGKEDRPWPYDTKMGQGTDRLCPSKLWKSRLSPLLLRLFDLGPGVLK